MHRPSMHAASRLIAVCAALSAFLIQAAQFRFAGQTFTVPDGFVVEQATDTNLVQRPVSASFDEHGRLYVTDSSGSNEKPEKQLAKPPHRLVRLEDTDGDGRFDKSVVFADQVMFPQGCLWHDGWVYVAGPPSIWRFRDRDGDGVAEQRQEWFKGGTLTGCGNDIHGPYLGPDNYLYWTKGAFAEQTHTLGNGRKLNDRAAHIYRAQADGSELEVIMSGGMDNPVEVAFTAEGEAIFTSTFIDFGQPGWRDGLAHAVYGGVFGKQNEVLEDGRLKRTGPELLHPFVQFGPGVPSGLCRYESTVFGDEYRDNFFATLFNLRKVTRHALGRSGASYQSTNSDFFVSDAQDFHPTDVLEDADGSLLVVDTGGWYKLCCPSSQLAKPDVLGAIYRVRKSGTPRLSADERLSAYRRLTRPPGLDGQSPVSSLKLAALRRDGNSSDWFLRRLAESAPRAGASATSAHIARVAAEGLGRIGHRPAVPVLLEAMATTPDDTCLEHSLIFALIEIAEATGTRAGLKSRVPAIQRAALIALDQMEGGELKAADVLPFLSSTDPRLRDAARWIFRRHPEWAGDGAAFVREFLTKLSAAMPPDEEQNRLLQLLAVAPAVQIELARRFAVAPAADQASLLRVVVEARPKEFAPEWVATVRAALTNKEPSVVSAAVRAARALSPDVKKPNPEAVEFKPLLLELARDTARTRDIRLAAILAVAGPIEGLDAALLEFALSALDATNLPPVRAQALEVLQRAKLDTDALQRLADGLPRVGAIELPRLFALFEQSLDEAVGRKLLASLRQSTVAKSLPAASVRALFAKYPEAVQADAAVLIEGLDADAAKQAARFETLLADVKAQSSDIRRGQAIFNSPKTACATCHKIGYLGGTLGPDLTRISEVRSERDLLEAIVYPSASFVRSYEPVILITKSGEEHSGVLRKDAADEVVLGTGPDTEVRVARTEIGEMRPGNVSVMPQGLDEQLSRQELADLMAFLKNTRWGAQ